MQKIKDIITPRQLTIVIISTILGVDGFMMPRLVVQAAGRDGWLSLLIAGLWMLLVSGSLAYLASQFPRQAPNIWLEKLFNSWVAKGFVAIYGIFFLLMSAWALRTFCDMTRVFLLPRTPTEVIMITFLLSVAYLVSNGINPMVRVTQVFFPFIVLPFLFMIITYRNRMDFGELLPVMAEGILPVLKGIPPSIAVFIGWGVVFFLIQFMETPRGAVKASVIGMGFLWVFFLWTFIVTLLSFGPVEMKYLLYPVIDLVREMEGPATFIEKLDLLFLSFWIMTVFVTISFIYYVPVLTTAQLMGLKEHRSLTFLGLPLIYLIARLPKGNKAAEDIGVWLGYGSLVIGVIVLIAVVWVIVKKRRGGLPNAEQV